MLFQTNLVGFGKCAGLSTVISLSGQWGGQTTLGRYRRRFSPWRNVYSHSDVPMRLQGGGRCRYGGSVWSEEFKITLLSLVLWVVDLGTERDSDIYSFLLMGGSKRRPVGLSLLQCCVIFPLLQGTENLSMCLPLSGSRIMWALCQQPGKALRKEGWFATLWSKEGPK